ncbi:MAG: 5'-3' exonuclease H3TH domain-containing protein [Patescibacteria group bacterium]
MKTLLLIDNHALIYRFFHALPPLTTPKGEPIGAIYGLASVLLKIIREQKPDYMVACFDRPEPTFRDELYDKYKIHRPTMPSDLQSQVGRAHELFEKFGIKSIEQIGFEADDLIGTLVEKFKGVDGLVIIILSGDLDVLQLVIDDKVVVQFLKKGISDTIIYNEKKVFERYGIKPEQLPDLKGLLGDTSDNIPGIAGVGPKTAGPLIQKHGSLEKLFDNLWEVPDKIGARLENQKEAALFSKKLATIRIDVPLWIKLEDLERRKLDRVGLAKYFEELGFKSLAERLERVIE